LTPAKSELAQQTSRVRHQRRNPAKNHHSVVTEAVTEFYQLREGDDLTALGTLQLIRVELPSSALSDVGLPVSLEAVNARVKADVVLGEDGLARAIRFVR
jgi:hypothetical protein